MAHEHEWLTRSTHLTSEGAVTYQQCSCGVYRLLQGATEITRTGRGMGTGQVPASLS